MQSHPLLKKYLIGAGSFGKVYRFQSHGAQYALKKVSLNSIFNPALVAQLDNQAQTMKKTTKHRNIVSLLGDGKKDNQIYLLLQYVRGGDLRRVNHLLPEQHLWEIVMQLAMAVNHLRKCKVVHRDIKPENIMVKQVISENGKQLVIKLGDFGVSSILKNGEFLNEFIGSPLYIAPEIFKGRYNQYSFEVDIWSLGITIYQLLNSQRTPYHDEIMQFTKEKEGNYNETEILQFLSQVVTKKGIQCTSKYEELDKLVNKMLSKDPKERPTPLQILKHPKVRERIKKFNNNQKNNMSLGHGAKSEEESQNRRLEIENKIKIEQKFSLSYSLSLSELEIFLSSRVQPKEIEISK